MQNIVFMSSQRLSFLILFPGVSQYTWKWNVLGGKNFFSFDIFCPNLGLGQLKALVFRLKGHSS